LREAAGFYYQEFSNLTQPLPLENDPFDVGEDNRVSVWAEFLIPETAEVLARYENPFLGRFPAITRNKFGKGTLTYEGSYLTMPLQKAVLTDVLEAAALTSTDQGLPEPVKVKHSISGEGKPVHFYLNYSVEEQTFRYPYSGGIDLLTKKSVESETVLVLKPWDLAIIFED
jgi:beta-galactosidase